MQKSGSPRLTCHLSTSVLPSPARSLHAADSVNSVCQASGRGQEGLGSRHLPHCFAGWAQAGPLRLPSPLPFCRRRAGGRAGGRAAVSGVAAPAKGTGRATSWWTAKSNFVTAQQNETSLESASDSQEVGLGVLFCLLRSRQGQRQPATIIFTKELRKIHDFQQLLTLFCPWFKICQEAAYKMHRNGSDHCLQCKGAWLQYLPSTSLTKSPTPVPGDGFKSKNMISKLTAPMHKARLCGDNRAAWGTGAG